MNSSRSGIAPAGTCRRIALAATALACLGLASGPARAAFPNCQAPLATPNPPLMPNADGTYPSDPALPYAGTHTVWRVVNGIEIEQRIKTASQVTPTVPFIVHGVNYEPTQIGGAASFPPYNDFFYTSDTDVWKPLWDRDVKTLRALGVNGIRTYGMWKAEPQFAQGGPALGTVQYWPQIDFRAKANETADVQFCMPNNNGVYAFVHRSHTAFLDRLWNNGVNPIYIWIGISLPLDIVLPGTPPADEAAYVQFYRYTAKWLAKMYGNHPAVMGFVVGNEIDTAGTTPNKLFWDVVNDIGQVVKASAPDKLTMTVFHDTPDYNAMVSGTGLRGPQLYSNDVYGFNPYNNPSVDGTLFQTFGKNVVECTRPDGSSCKKPLLFGEFGTPADTHEPNSAISNTSYPLAWSEPNELWNPNPPPPQCLASSQLGPPPGPGGKGPEAEYAAQMTIGHVMPARNGAYLMPSGLTVYFPGSTAGQPLKAALQADWLDSFLKTAAAYRVDPNAPVHARKFNSGGFAFEWRDEWWKGNEKYPFFHSISGTDECTSCPAMACNTGAANATFPGGWGDEEWFGVTGAKPNGRKASDPVVNPFTGKLNGGPDTLEPRAAIVAICQDYGAAACAP